MAGEIMEPVFERLVFQWGEICHNMARFDDQRRALLRANHEGRGRNAYEVALLALGIFETPIELFEEALVVKQDRGAPTQHTAISRHDLLVGFYLDQAEAALSLELWIGGTFAGNLRLQPGKGTLAFGDRHVIPMISLRYHEVHVKLVGYQDPKIRVIHGLLQRVPRRHIAERNNRFEGDPAVVHRGMFSGATREAMSWVAGLQDMGAYPLSIPDTGLLQNDESACWFPNLAVRIDQSWRNMVAKKKEWLTRENSDGLCLKEELIRKAWHPSRLSMVFAETEEIHPAEPG
jgi:hypothetical protein